MENTEPPEGARVLSKAVWDSSFSDRNTEIIKSQERRGGSEGMWLHSDVETPKKF